MILKSFEIENNIKNIINFKFILIYGENIGLIEDLKKRIVSTNKGAEIINLHQELHVKIVLFSHFLGLQIAFPGDLVQKFSHH